MVRVIGPTTATTFYEVNSVVIREELCFLEAQRQSLRLSTHRVRRREWPHRRVQTAFTRTHLNRSFLRPPSLPVPLLRHSSNVPTSLESIFSPTSASEFLFNALSCAQFTSVALERYVSTIEKLNVEGIKRYRIVWKHGEARVFFITIETV